MSMPTFPENGINLTKEQAFHMLLGSVAMEELALSHIMNAEGEKLQYILGTLPGSHPVCSTPQEILEVNCSITDLLERVTQSQMLLKGKLAQVIKGMELCHVCCPNTPPTPPCASPSPSGQMNCVLHASMEYNWKKGHHLPLKPAYCNGEAFCWNADSPSCIRLPSNKAIMITYCFQLCFCETDYPTVTLQTLKNSSWEDISVCNCCAYEDQNVITLSGNTVLHPTHCVPTPSPIAFCLCNVAEVTVRQATISLMEL